MLTGFDLIRLLRELNIVASKDVLVNWDRYDTVDRMNLVDLSRYFTDIWYPGADDIEVLDDSCAWVLVVPHSGNVSIAVLTVPT